jgi:hypothetical protein
MTDPPSPLVIGGVGGSGTRVFSQIARATGRLMGDLVNASDDALELMGFVDRWLAPYHAARRAGEDVPDADAMRFDLHACLDRHRAGGAGAPGRPWGFKQPRSIHFLPFLRAELPELRFLHVVRDGRDVAFGRQAATVLENAGDALLGAGWRDIPAPVALIELWDVANGLAADYAESEMGDAYLRVRFEDLCRAPDDVVGRVARFTGGDADAAVLATVAARVAWPASIGIWRRADTKLAREVEERGTAGLERFGYAGARFRRPLRTRLRAGRGALAS